MKEIDLEELPSIKKFFAKHKISLPKAKKFIPRDDIEEVTYVIENPGDIDVLIKYLEKKSDYLTPFYVFSIIYKGKKLSDENKDKFTPKEALSLLKKIKLTESAYSYEIDYKNRVRVEIQLLKGKKMENIYVSPKEFGRKLNDVLIMHRPKPSQK